MSKKPIAHSVSQPLLSSGGQGAPLEALQGAFARALSPITPPEDEPALSLPSRSSEPSEASRQALSAAVAAYRGTLAEPLSAGEGAMLDRLDRFAMSEDPTRALVALKLDERKAASFVAACTMAFRLDSGAHKAQLEALRDAPDYEKWLASLIEMRNFFGRREDCRAAVDILRAATLLSRGFREDNLRSISRKGDATAARSRAVGWVKGSVHQLSGKANVKHVAALASVVLDASIGLEVVKKAKTPSAWLDEGRAKGETSRRKGNIRSE
jgi:hypothetical protein